MPILDGGILQVAGLHCEQCTDYRKQINTLFAVESRTSFVSNWPGVSLYSFHRTDSPISLIYLRLFTQGAVLIYDSSNRLVFAGSVRPVAIVLFQPAVNAWAVNPW